jgi:hypothetical protein
LHLIGSSSCWEASRSWGSASSSSDSFSDKCSLKISTSCLEEAFAFSMFRLDQVLCEVRSGGEGL